MTDHMHEVRHSWSGTAEETTLKKAISLLELHRTAFNNAAEFASATGHPVPSDTRAWSQILVSLLTGIKGLAQKKGADLEDGSDVKAANVWRAIDTPRFNGCLKAGRKGTSAEIETLDEMPNLFFVMWDHTPGDSRDRCRVWVVRPKEDPQFRGIAVTWYGLRRTGEIKSDNFQLHPPRNLDTNVFRNTCGNLKYPLLFRADWMGDRYQVVSYNPELLNSGVCETVDEVDSLPNDATSEEAAS